MYGAIMGTTQTGEDREHGLLPVMGPVMNRLMSRSRIRASRMVMVGLNGSGSASSETRMDGARRIDGASQGSKRRLLLGAAGCRRGTSHYSTVRGLHAFEFPWRMGLATLGLRVLVGANDLIARYLGLEWSSLCLYVLASIRRGSAYSTEAGLKYFIMGAVSSGFYLFGSSLVYGVTGSLQFGERGRRRMGGSDAFGSFEGSARRSMGLAMIRMAFRFKLAVAPFHAWSPDVYEGSPTPSTIYFAVVPKRAMSRVILRLCFGPFGEWFSTIQPMRRMGAMRSRTVAALAARAQRRLKRFRAYSAIGHMGYLMLGISSGSIEGVQAARLYGMIYRVMSLNVWLAVMSVIRTAGPISGDGSVALRSAKYRTDRGGLHRRNPFLAATLALSVRSMAGIPPRAGFMAKWWVFLAAMSQSLVLSSVLAVRASCVGAYYYLRWVKIMYFDGTTGTMQSSWGDSSHGVSAVTLPGQSGDRVPVDEWTSRMRGVTFGIMRLLLRVPGPLRWRTHRMALALVLM